MSRNFFRERSNDDLAYLILQALHFVHHNLIFPKLPMMFLNHHIDLPLILLDRSLYFSLSSRISISSSEERGESKINIKQV